MRSTGAFGHPNLLDADGHIGWVLSSNMNRSLGIRGAAHAYDFAKEQAIGVVLSSWAT